MYYTDDLLLLALYKSLEEHSNALKSLKREYDKLKEDEKTLADILSQLRAGYNPNYQDMAVLEAVRGWEFYAGLPHIGDTDNSSSGEDEGTDTTVVDGPPDMPPDEPLEEGMWSKEKLEHQLGSLLYADHTNLLMEHDNHVGTTTEKSLCKSPPYCRHIFF